MKTKTFLLLLLCLASLAASAANGDKWRVTDQDLTVWDSPEYLNKLGMIHRGYEFEEVAMDGNMIQFEYNGQKAFVASYCCERVEEAAGQAVAAPVSQETKSVSAGPSAREVSVPDNSTVAPDKVSDSQTTSTAEENIKSALEGVPDWVVIVILVPVILIIFVLAISSFVFTIIYAFKYKKLRAWFNKKCDVECIPEKRINYMLKKPLIALAAMIVINIASSVIFSGFDGSITPLRVVGILVAVCLVIGIPVIILRSAYKQYAEQFGKKAAKWMTCYSLLSIVALYIISMVVLYIVLAILALYAIAFLLEQTKSGGALSIDGSDKKERTGMGYKCSNCSNYYKAGCPILHGKGSTVDDGYSNYCP